MVNALSRYNFDFEINGTPGVYVVRFWADWCQPCLAMSETFATVAGEMWDRAHFAEINIDLSPEIADRFLEQRIPQILLFKDGKIINRMDSLVPKPQTVHAIEVTLH